MNNKPKLVMLCLLLGCAQPSFAWKHVIDLQAIAQLENQLEEMKRLRDTQLGHSGFGQLLNSAEDLKQRQWSADSWEEALQGLSGGNPQRYLQLRELFEQQEQPMTQAEFEQGASEEQAINYQHDLDVTELAHVESSYTYNDINTHLKKIHELSQQIEKADTLKAATDLNSRLNAELAYIQIEQLKMQSIANQQAARQQTTQLSERAAKSRFHRIEPRSDDEDI